MHAHACALHCVRSQGPEPAKGRAQVHSCFAMLASPVPISCAYHGAHQIACTAVCVHVLIRTGITAQAHMLMHQGLEMLPFELDKPAHIQQIGARDKVHILHSMLQTGSEGLRGVAGNERNSCTWPARLH